MRNRKLVLTVRILLGAFILFSGIGGFMAGPEMKNIPEPMVQTTTQLWNMGFFQLVKATEVVVGLMLLTGFLPALALLMLAPVMVCVIVFNANVSPQYLPTGIIVTLIGAYLGYAYWDKYRAIFTK